MKQVFLDAGHGGVDSGATGNGYKEKDLTLRLCLDVEKEVKRHGVGSSLTRKDDRFVSLEKRSEIANILKADAFISFHFNSAANDNAKGLETFHYPNSINGSKLATKIQNELVNAKLCLANRGVKQANFSVLRRTNMPSSLLEVCFINNKEDIEFFIANYDKYVQVITKAIVEYFGIKYIAPNTNIVGPSKPQIAIVKDKINLLLLSEHIAVDGFIKEGTSYVNINDSYIAIREILENLGLIVSWDNDLKVITADINKEYVKEKGSTDVLLLGNKINIKTHMHKDKNCIKINGAYIPTRDIFESLGFKVKWNNADNMILITK